MNHIPHHVADVVLPALAAKHAAMADAGLYVMGVHAGAPVGREVLSGKRLAGHPLKPKAGARKAAARRVAPKQEQETSATGSVNPLSCLGRDGSKVWCALAIAQYGGPFLFGKQRGMAGAMHAPMAPRFLTHEMKVNKTCIPYCHTVMTMSEMKKWVAAAGWNPTTSTSWTWTSGRAASKRHGAR